MNFSKLSTPGTRTQWMEINRHIAGERLKKGESDAEDYMKRLDELALYFKHQHHLTLSMISLEDLDQWVHHRTFCPRYVREYGHQVEFEVSVFYGKAKPDSVPLGSPFEISPDTISSIRRLQAYIEANCPKKYGKEVIAEGARVEAWDQTGAGEGKWIEFSIVDDDEYIQWWIRNMTYGRLCRLPFNVRLDPERNGLVEQRVPQPEVGFVTEVDETEMEID